MISSTPTARLVAAARPHPVPWTRLAWVTQRQRRGAVIGTSIVLGLFAVYLLVMAIIQNNAYAAVHSVSPGRRAEVPVAGAGLLPMTTGAAAPGG